MQIIEKFSDIYLVDYLEYFCPYYNDGRIAAIELVYPFEDQMKYYNRFLEHGFCRTGGAFFQNLCKGCKECIPYRLKLDEFKSNRNHKRVIRINSDVRFEIFRSQDINDEKVELFTKYRKGRHNDDEQHHFKEEVKQIHYGYPFTFQVHFYLNDKLIGVSIVDESLDALSSHCFYYDPSFPKRSLGVYSILVEIMIAKNLGKSFYYLGYYIEKIPNMSYKGFFRPGQMLLGNEWKNY